VRSRAIVVIQRVNVTRRAPRSTNQDLRHAPHTTRNGLSNCGTTSTVVREKGLQELCVMSDLSLSLFAAPAPPPRRRGWRDRVGCKTGPPVLLPRLCVLHDVRVPGAQWHLSLPTPLVVSSISQMVDQTNLYWLSSPSTDRPYPSSIMAALSGPGEAARYLCACTS